MCHYSSTWERVDIEWERSSYTSLYTGTLQWRFFNQHHLRFNRRWVTHMLYNIYFIFYVMIYFYVFLWLYIFPFSVQVVYISHVSWYLLWFLTSRINRHTFVKNYAELYAYSLRALPLLCGILYHTVLILWSLRLFMIYSKIIASVFYVVQILCTKYSCFIPWCFFSGNCSVEIYVK